ncbi:MAG: ORF6N domain-containing protein [Candidatus Pedobacter colombiensis]|uniref:ORF6N domain-containing protein n=1 Tax=Candidatus Pedobacter colombiensis TaxID=3121371 RepID=A0AAJ5WDA7_9SPHI|nr:ORF6N domain-containing protein [Pedobacter sp.]WEK21491.1 MAG: ORF6N domain-containing protein [Pedobacter sp.]
MTENKDNIMIPDEIIINQIYHIRGFKVMLDTDLAVLYEVETKQLKRQVKRNIDRFPEDFMFELGNEEQKILRSQFGTLRHGQHSK